jgi:hypothetical protein
LQAGHLVACDWGFAVRFRGSPHEGQNAAPSKSKAMQFGHPMVARRHRQ